MATELAKAYVQIIPSAKGIGGALEDIMDTEADKAGKSSGSKLLSGIGSVLGKGAAVAGAGLAAAAGSISALSKTALSAFADYEQLTGGVETLFGDSADIIFKYAESAYQTAGLSANEYMETVTSFSASLLQSLDGDTAAAADYAQKAITDMSDNANKMGTSMESIQNAYQGFAKQNFTMLDNLKLGYGGTKAEMERLLEDAMELSGVEYDISSYADIVEAIHVVQTNLGITGTTAKEASTTITGSVNAMKSAWTNFLTSMNGNEEQMQKSTNALVESVVTAAKNIIPKLSAIIPNIVNGLGNLVTALLPEIPTILNTLLPALIEGASSLVSQLVTVLPQILKSLTETIPILIDAIMTMLPLLLQAAIEILNALAQGLIQSLPVLIPAAVDMVTELVDTLIDNIDLLISAAIDLTLALAKGLLDALPKLLAKIPEIIEALVTALTNPESLAKMISGAFELILGIVSGMYKALPEILLAMPKIIKSMIEGFKTSAAKFKEVGPDIIAGLWEGIKNNWSSLVNNFKNLGSELLSGIKGIFGIHSPSTEFAAIGEMCDAGLAEGLGGMKGTIADTKSMLADEMSNGFGVNTSLNLRNNLSQGSALNAATTQNTGMSAQIASAVYEALNGMALNASITGTPDSKKWFDEMRIQARLYNRRTGQEAFV